MFQRLSSGFSLARSSWAVLVKDKHLILFPVVSGFLLLLVLASFLVPLGTLVDWNQFQQQTEANDGKPPVWVYPVAFAFYFFNYFVIIFCNSALVSCALMRFNGQEPRLSDGFRMAFSRLPQIFAWALVSATVGMILKAIESNEKVGRFITSIIGAAWSLMTFFVVPVLVVEKLGPVQAVKRSVSLIGQTWGESLGGRIGIGLVMFLLFLPIILLFVGGAYLLNNGQQAPGIALIVAGVIAVLLHGAISSALNTILMAALYQYASHGKVPDGFEGSHFSTAFESKPQTV